MKLERQVESLSNRLVGDVVVSDLSVKAWSRYMRSYVGPIPPLVLISYLPC